MEIILSILSFLGVFISVAGAFIGGWYIATDKNRNELFKQRLTVYKNVSAQVSKVYTLGVSLDKIDCPGSEEIYKSAAANLLQLVMAEALFLEEDTMKKIMNFLQMKPTEYSKNKAEINDIISSFRKDLSLKNLDIMNQLSSLSVDTKRLLRRGQ